VKRAARKSRTPSKVWNLQKFRRTDVRKERLSAFLGTLPDDCLLASAALALALLSPQPARSSSLNHAADHISDSFSLALSLRIGPLLFDSVAMDISCSTARASPAIAPKPCSRS
jgi:hypothetical protein